LALGVLIVALIIRAVFIIVDPLLSDDLFRYLWEGRVQLEGFNPFVYSPSSEQLFPLRDHIWEQVGHKEVSTIYPPGSLAMFRVFAATTYSPIIVKITAALADFITVAIIYIGTRKKGLGATILWAIHPLPVLESAQNGHIEATAIMLAATCLLLIQRGDLTKAWVFAVIGGLVKLLPLALLVPIIKRQRLTKSGLLLLLTAIAIGLSLTPWLDPTLIRGFNRYYEAWSFNASGFNILLLVFGEPATARLAGVAIGATFCLLAATRKVSPAMFFLCVSAALIALSPVVHPWYVLWALLPALWVGAWPWAVLATTSLWSYHVLGTYEPVTATWTEAWWIPAIEYTVPLIATIFWLRRQKRPLNV